MYARAAKTSSTVASRIDVLVQISPGLFLSLVLSYVIGKAKEEKKGRQDVLGAETPDAPVLLCPLYLFWPARFYIGPGLLVQIGRHVAKHLFGVDETIGDIVSADHGSQVNNHRYELVSTAIPTGMQSRGTNRIACN